MSESNTYTNNNHELEINLMEERNILEAKKIFLDAMSSIFEGRLTEEEIENTFGNVVLQNSENLDLSQITQSPDVVGGVINQLKEQSVINQKVYFVVNKLSDEQKEKIVALFGLMLTDENLIEGDQENAELKITEFFVGEGNQREGIGTEVLQTVIKSAREELVNVHLTVDEKNPASAFYEGEGFTQNGTVDREITIEGRAEKLNFTLRKMFLDLLEEPYPYGSKD
jgi:ribosomal protein S18 acetylase RimI-like enzyme